MAGTPGLGGLVQYTISASKRKTEWETGDESKAVKVDREVKGGGRGLEDGKKKVIRQGIEETSIRQPTNQTNNPPNQKQVNKNPN